MEIVGPTNALGGLITEVAGLANRLRRPGLNREAHELAGGLLAIARVLRGGGPQTVPRIAQVRNTSRQNIQAAVNQLKQLGLVELKANPAHKRSMLLELTDKGLGELATADEKEEAYAGVMLDTISEDQIAAAAATVRRVREHLFGPERRVADATDERLRVRQRRKTTQEKVAEPAQEAEMPISLL